LFLGRFKDSSKHDQRVGVHSSHSAQRFAHIVGIDAQWHLWLEKDFGFVTGFDEHGKFDLDVAGGLSSLPQNLHHLARGLGGSDVDRRGESSLSFVVGALQLTRVILDEDGGLEGLRSGRWAVIASFTDDKGDISDLGHVLLGESLDVDSDVVSRSSLLDGLVVHFDGEQFSFDTSGGESNGAARLHGTLFNSASDNITDTLDLVHSRDGHTNWFLGWSLRAVDNVVQGVQQGLSFDFLLLWLDLESLVPRHVGGLFDEVVSLESGHGHERDLLGLEANLGKHLLDLSLDFLVSFLGVWGWLGGVHLVDTDDDLLNSQKVEETGVLTGLSLNFSLLMVSLLDRSLETTLVGRNHE